MRKVHDAGHDRLGPVARQIDPVEVDLSAVDVEPGSHVGPERFVRLDLDGAVREHRPAAVVAEPAVHLHGQVSRHGRPRGRVVVEGELAA